MNISELTSNYNINDSVIKIIDDIKILSGKDVDIQLLDNLQVDGTTKIARKKMEKHIIKINRSRTMLASHIIVHECGHIKRMMEATPSERVIPASTTKNIQIISEQLKSELQKYPPQMREKAIQIFSNGLIMQLTNLSVDFRIEEWIYSNIRPIREEQKKYLLSDVNKILQALSRKTESSTPPTVFINSGAITYAYLTKTEHIHGIDFESKYKKFPRIVSLGSKLLEEIDPNDSGFVGDISLVKRWGKILNMNDWFEWVDFENVPSSYYE